MKNKIKIQKFQEITLIIYFNSNVLNNVNVSKI